MRTLRGFAVVDERGEICGSERSGLCIFRDKRKAVREKGALEVVVPCVIIVEGLIRRVPPRPPPKKG